MPYVVSVSIFIKPEFAEQFIKASLDNARNSRQETGNLRFDVLQAEDDPTRFQLYEAYAAKEDFALHQQTAHYQRWKDAVAPWMAQPRIGVKHHSLFFDDSGT